MAAQQPGDLLELEVGTLERRARGRHVEAEPHRVGDDPGQPPTLHVHGDDLTAGRALRDQVDEALGDRQLVHRACAGQYGFTGIVGVCICSTTFPPPVYMCTPHGRHGSKLRTARMMSMPLKLSGGFSSKIGVFCTASS